MRFDRQWLGSFFQGVILALALIVMVAGTWQIATLTGETILLDSTNLSGRPFAEALQGTLLKAGTALVLLTTLAFNIPLFAFLAKARAKQQADHAAAFNATHDPLTGLANRVHFVERLGTLIADHRRREARLAVLCVDLDGLKEINEAHGHDVGDGAIVEVARALAATAGSQALVARLGGDEFAVACPDVGTTAEVAELAARLLAEVGAPRTIKGESVAVSARVGIALMPSDGEDLLRLMKAADLALDRARAEREGAIVFFEHGIEAALLQRRDLELQIRDALARDAFDLHFQPLFENLSGRLLGFEALLRMPAHAGGFVSPAVFVPVAEEMGLITEIGDWVLRRACSIAAQWPDSLSVAVNLSPAQFKDGVHRNVQRALSLAGLAPGRLQLEITEGLLLDDDPVVMQELTALKGLGVLIAMDDFGTGYSSLSYLWKFPFDKIKIDRSFMRAFDSDEKHVSDILQAIMSLSRALRMRVTAEGVETAAQAAFLRSIGCDEVQGYHFGRPVPLIDVAAILAEEARRSLARPEPPVLERGAA